ncbi:uncharacterized protein EI90DRAFT_3056938 [Cantharellus anzutake]|uniref:uncharacterized protein n=1 Tax=Cantharellus anzutake TaxID=1750568 RepID=UPI001903ED73|nr:uncharacterized protein EI90DRAFT_3056938 [Cantharellus anzutake]KAF8331684.1 hypothetical protein EI90DRAFT_3056938 [Cantharellus anzutake]
MFLVWTLAPSLMSLCIIPAPAPPDIPPVFPSQISPSPSVIHQFVACLRKGVTVRVAFCVFKLQSVFLYLYHLYTHCESFFAFAVFAFFYSCPLFSPYYHTIVAFVSLIC